MVLPDPAKINLAKLPSISIEDRAFLPNIPAIYFVMNAEQVVLYIGQTKSLCFRWSHHEKRPHFIQREASRIAWISVQAVDQLHELEETCINYFQPAINTFLVPSLSRNGIMKTMGDRIKERRKSKGLSQGKLARRADLDQALLSRIESGDTKNPGVNAVAAIALALGCSMDHLYGLYDDTPAPQTALAGVGR